MSRLEWHLRQNGVHAQGTITDLRDLNLKLNGAQQWRLQYEYRDFQGHPHLKTFAMPQDEAHMWKVGDVGAVLYDSTRPTYPCGLAARTRDDSIRLTGT